MKITLAAIATAIIMLVFPVDNTAFQSVQEVYIVQPGDTLWGVATRYLPKDDRGEYILQFKEEIIQNNPFLKTRLMRPGDKIVVTLYLKKTD